jgi:hypothetical protein
MVQWHLATAMIRGYAERYATEDFEVVEVEKDSSERSAIPILAGRVKRSESRARSMASFVATMDCICSSIRRHQPLMRVISTSCGPIRKSPCTAITCGNLGYPIVGVIYNVLLKSRLKQGKGETQEEYEVRHAELAAKNKSGKSTAKRQMPETDDEFQARLTEWYSRPEAFHREFIYLSEDRLAMLQDEVWEITQQYLDARRRGKWLLNTSNCFSYQRPCEYLAYCQSGFNPNVADNLYEIALPNEELSRVDSEAPPF